MENKKYYLVKEELEQEKVEVTCIYEVFNINTKFQTFYVETKIGSIQVKKELFDIYSGKVKKHLHYLVLNKNMIKVDESVYAVYLDDYIEEKKRVRVYSKYSVVSYNEYTNEDENLCLIDLIEDLSIIPIVDKMFAEDLMKNLSIAFNKLEDDEKCLIKEIYFNRKKETDLTIIFGLTQASINRKKNKILKKLFSEISKNGYNSL